MTRSILHTEVVVLTSLLFVSRDALAQENVTRFEIGGQFTLMSRSTPTPLLDDFSRIPRHVNKPGFGGRFTYNFTTSAVDSLGLLTSAGERRVVPLDFEK